MKKSCFILFLLSIIILTSCDFLNNGKDTINFINSSPNEVSVAHLHTDSLFNHTEFYISNCVLPNNSYKLELVDYDAWIRLIEKNEDKKLKVYIFLTDTLKKYRKDFTIKQLILLQKYDSILKYSEQDLDELNWKIIYK